MGATTTTPTNVCSTSGLRIEKHAEKEAVKYGMSGQGGGAVSAQCSPAEQLCRHGSTQGSWCAPAQVAETERTRFCITADRNQCAGERTNVYLDLALRPLFPRRI